MRESTIEDYLKRRVNETGGFMRKAKWLDRRGAPDRLVWWPFHSERRDAFVELKRPGKKAEAYQAREHDRLRAGGFRVFVIDTLEGVDAFVQEMTA